MSLFRLILIGMAIYLVSKVFRKLLNPPQQNRRFEESQQQTSDPLDLSDADIEDAEFEEIDGEEPNKG
jgi:hypothetical protein